MSARPSFRPFCTGLDRTRDLDQLAGGSVGIGVKAGFSELQLIRLVAALGAAN